MRCQLKRNAVLGILLLLVVLYFIGHSDFVITGLKRAKTSTISRWTWISSPKLRNEESWVDQGNYLPLNVSYQLLAGTQTSNQRFLVVGLASVKREKGSYLLSTLRSLFSQSSPEERSSMVVVVLLADFNADWREATVGEIKAEFTSELDQGQLLVLHVPQQYYPPLSGLKRNFNDAPSRVSFRSKQNVDYSFLIHYSLHLSQYYLQLEDDISSARNFLSSIRRHIQEQEDKSVTWATLEFSSLGYIGKLYQSAHLPLLARFLFLFYQEMPCDWLLTHFRQLLTQKEQILLKPSLFQHMGTFSSFQGTYNKLKDKDFEAEGYSNPSADVYSDISVYKDHIPRLAWAAGDGYFWGRSPEKGNYLTVVLRAPTIVTGITVETGLNGKDLLYSAVIELGHDVHTTEKGEKSCMEFRSLGNIKDGKFEMQEVDKEYGSTSSCVRIQVTDKHTDWVAIQKIRITTKS
ncbi:alpha-1,3-mannosyl-glycoprotein 4-beta-N-acetylglucosaminyltransferase C [Polymixia lowei]